VDDWEIQKHNLIIIDTEKLGSGASAIVYKGILRGNFPMLNINRHLNLALDMTDNNQRNEVAVKVQLELRL
jgi:hypothetical protein